ncbi:MAG: FHA domain-containing protein, partial [Gloeotrichia echinulata HAB0833]
PEPIAVAPEPIAVAPEPMAAPVSPARTQLQLVTARLYHVQSDTDIELPQTLSVIHIGKPNDRIPPDIDVSGFPNSEIVSRIHADIRVEADAHYVEDVGSSNGTYINNLPLLPGNRHRLRPGDRISLGKGDLMTFLFQLS